MAVAETHLIRNDELRVAGYTWFGQNRSNIHVNATSGSGGIGLLIENIFASNYNIQVLDKSHEGILWINFKHVLTGSSFNLCVCVCYLPPEGSSRYVNVDECFDTLLTKVYTLRKHAYSNILKILPPKTESFQIKNSDIFHISAQNIDCGYSLEPPRRGGSNEYPQSMF